MRIREASVSDAGGIARVHVDTWRTAYAGIVPAGLLAQLSCERSEGRWRENLSGAGTFGYVAEDDDGRIVGFAFAGPERDGDPVYQGELYAIYILEDYQRRGIGRQLVRAVVGRLVERGLYSMLIWVLAENPARGFYEALGGQPVRQKHLERGGKELLEIAYGWEDIRPLLAPASPA